MKNLDQNEELEGAEKAMITRPVACCVLRDEEQIQGEMKGDGDALRQVEGAEFEDLRLKTRFSTNVERATRNVGYEIQGERYGAHRPNRTDVLAWYRRGKASAFARD